MGADGQQPLVVADYTLVSALGPGRVATLDSLRAGRSGLVAREFEGPPHRTWVGEVPDLLSVRVPQALSSYDCRNHRLVTAALAEDGFSASVARVKAQVGAGRIAVLMGTSTSGVENTERAYAQWPGPGHDLPPWFHYRETQDPASGVEFVRQWLGLRGPSFAVSTACSSSAKVFASASRLIAAGWCDAVVVGAADSLCLTTLCGFDSLELLSRSPCRPFSTDRDGISIGEAAGFALVVRSGLVEGGIALTGYGESSDGYHMSSPRPDGAGASAAMETALAEARLGRSDVDYIHLHGTGTRANDAAEDCAVMRVFGSSIPGSSTKGYTGHALGAAGFLGAVMAFLAIEQQWLPPTLGTSTLDPAFRSRIVLDPTASRVRHVMVNAFGFGGSNCALIFSRT